MFNKLHIQNIQKYGSYIANKFKSFSFFSKAKKKRPIKMIKKKKSLSRL